MKKTTSILVLIKYYDFGEDRDKELGPEVVKVSASSFKKAKRIAEALKCKEYMRLVAYIVSVKSKIIFSSAKNERRWKRIYDRGMRSRTDSIMQHIIAETKVSM